MRAASRRLFSSKAGAFRTRINYTSTSVIELAIRDPAAASEHFWQPTREYNQLFAELGLRHAREDAGRKYVVEDFINRNRNVMSEYNPLFKQMSHAEQRAYLCREYQDRTSFADVHKELEEREHVMARSTSNQVRHCLTRAPRPKTAADAPGYGTHGKVRKQADGPWARA